MAYSAITKPSLYFDTLLYTGNGATGSGQTLSGLGFQPDMTWVKSRTTTDGHTLQDVVRGFGETTKLSPYDNSQQNNSSGGSYGNYGYQSAATSDGFTMVAGSNPGQNNKNTLTYAAWNWKAGDSNTSVTASGSGNNCYNACTHRANTTAGFSIITFTGRNDQISNGQQTRLTHGLGAKPDWVIIKCMTSNENWVVQPGGENDTHVNLNGTGAASGSYYTGNYNNNTSEYLVLGNSGWVNSGGETYVCYAFVEKQGFSKFGKYTGNGNADGTFVYTGFRPAFVLFKRWNGGTGNWQLLDSKRLGYNPDNKTFYPNTTTSEQSENDIDFLSNGFKIRSSGTDGNGNGDVYIYAAFAAEPFVANSGDDGVPATAKA